MSGLPISTTFTFERNRFRVQRDGADDAELRAKLFDAQRADPSVRA